MEEEMLEKEREIDTNLFLLLFLFFFHLFLLVGGQLLHNISVGFVIH